jgi:hypothetical protein
MVNGKRIEPTGETNPIWRIRNTAGNLILTR